MIDFYVTRGGGSTVISMHQGEGTLDETLVMTQDMANFMADAVIDDLTNGAITVHDEDA